ncbi:hypothetical protein RKE29_00920 [Streptomyces sp. B1866]|uniref:hypothetical protein n=1 Tax=Streptomyces sp. B1866 TaxID=3075431 RepID=UPI0028913A33|nr:hypothetical protein [Streptomyces sp. B1866]MDT3395225.1 hypothetical protein [Streptomyces sp. B1866]
MTFTISALLLFGILLAMLVRSKAVGVGTAVITTLFGFYLARTGAAESIDQIMADLANAIPKD